MTTLGSPVPPCQRAEARMTLWECVRAGCAGSSGRETIALSSGLRRNRARPGQPGATGSPGVIGLEERGSREEEDGWFRIRTQIGCVI